MSDSLSIQVGIIYTRWNLWSYLSNFLRPTLSIQVGLYGHTYIYIYTSDSLYTGLESMIIFNFLHLTLYTGWNLCSYLTFYI